MIESYQTICNTKYILDDVDETDYLTTVVGIKSSNGIVFASDSLFTGDETKMFGSKIFKVNHSIALGISGRMDQMEILFEALEQKIKDTKYSHNDALESDIIDALLALHKKYNLKWSEGLGKDVIVFKPESMLGAKLDNNKCVLYRLSFDPDPWVRPIRIYDSIGSGQLFASLVLRQQSRPPASDNKTFSDLPLKYNLWVACLTLAEIKSFDKQSGGSTKVALVTENDVILPPDDKIKEFYNTVVASISSTYGGVLAVNGNIQETERILRDIFPKDE